MNKQVSYILCANLIIAGIIGCFFLIKNISQAIVKGNSESFCGTESLVANEDYKGKAILGKQIFMSSCASCHSIFKDMTGPGLIGFEDRGPWNDRKKVYAWIRNPLAFMKKDKYTQNLKSKYISIMTGFPDLTNAEIDAICEYIVQSEKIQYQSIPVAER